MLKLDISKLDGFVAKSEFEAMFQEIEVAHKKLYDKSAPGSEFTGWVNLPENYDRDEFERIQQKKMLQKRIEDLSVLQNFSDFGVVYSNDITVGWISNTIVQMFPKGGLRIWRSGKS